MIWWRWNKMTKRRKNVWIFAPTGFLLLVTAFTKQVYGMLTVDKKKKKKKKGFQLQNRSQH